MHAAEPRRLRQDVRPAIDSPCMRPRSPGHLLDSQDRPDYEAVSADVVYVYFCEPATPMEGGTNENTGLMMLQYFPKGT